MRNTYHGFLCYQTLSVTKKEETLIFPFQKRSFKKTVIALGSLEHGAGLTSVCLALSNFLCSKAGKKTAYIELNTSNEICSLAKNSRVDVFSHTGFDLFPHRTFTSLADILQEDYDYFILDMGVLNTYSAKEFAKFEKQFLVCSLSKWKWKKTQEKLHKLLETTCISPKRICILSNCCKKESEIKVSPTVSIPVLSIPFIQNPFQLNFEFLSSFGKILGQY